MEAEYCTQKPVGAEAVALLLLLLLLLFEVAPSSPPSCVKHLVKGGAGDDAPHSAASQGSKARLLQAVEGPAPCSVLSSLSHSAVGHAPCLQKSTAIAIRQVGILVEPPRTSLGLLASTHVSIVSC